MHAQIPVVVCARSWEDGKAEHVPARGASSGKWSLRMKLLVLVYRSIPGANELGDDDDALRDVQDCCVHLLRLQACAVHLKLS